MNATTTGGILLREGASYEYVVSQLSSSMILCVVDGYELRMYNTVDEIPLELCLTGGYKIRNKSIDTIEYHWRSSSDGSMYAFFDSSVNSILLRREEENIRNRPVTMDSTEKEETKRYIRLKR